MTLPDWAVKFRRPGTELRRVNDALYKLDDKMRGDVEQAIDAFKNIIEALHSYTQDEKSRGMDICMPYCPSMALWSERPTQKSGVSNKFAPMDIARSLSRVRIGRVNNKWIPAEIMKKDRLLVVAADLHITPDKGIL